MSKSLERFDLLIDGELAPGESDHRFETSNPLNRAPWALAAIASEQDVDRAVVAAHKAFKEGPWPRMRMAERAKLLRRFAELLVEHADEIGRVETTDTGKLFRETEWQVRTAAANFNYYADLSASHHGEIPPSLDSRMLGLVLRQPVGVVAAIVPWNSQLLLATNKIGPALVTGNTMVVKASEDAPGPLLTMAKIAMKVGFPPGVFNVITGPANPTGIALTSHPLVRRISFTGGVETARKIIPNTAANIARLSLELGGKSPMFIFEDANIENAVNGILAGIFGAGGQSCGAASRLLLHDTIYDQVIERLLPRAQAIRLGDPMLADTEMGPLATQRQCGRIEGLLSDSLALEGSELLHRGEVPEEFPDGNFFAPTIVACAHQDLPIVREELFGPVLSVLRFHDEDEAIALANDSRYAFAGGVFTKSFPRAYRVVQAIQAGRIGINTYRVSTVNVPFGGFGYSGYGREGGSDALKDYTETKGMMMDISEMPIPDPFVMR
jgi:acyl-CoA reductase-like NAD-dependent aldehyde dehydrogenase